MKKKRFSVFELFSTRSEEGVEDKAREQEPYEPHPGRGRRRRETLSAEARVRGSLTVLGVLLAVSLVARVCGRPGRPVPGGGAPTLDTLALRAAFEGWLKMDDDSVNMTEYSIIRCTYDGNTGMINNIRYDRAAAMERMYEEVEELLSDSPDRVRYEQKQIRESLKRKKDRLVTPMDSIIYDVMREKEKYLRMMTGKTLTGNDLQSLLRGRRQEERRVMDSLAVRPGWFIRVKTAFGDSSAVMVDYLQTARDTLIIPLNVKKL